jgi:hypothetical protein
MVVSLWFLPGVFWPEGEGGRISHITPGPKMDARRGCGIAQEKVCIINGILSRTFVCVYTCSHVSSAIEIDTLE